MLNSLRFTLLVWFAAVLIVVLLGLGLTLYGTQRHALLQRVDERLRSQLQQLQAAVVVESNDTATLQLPPTLVRTFRAEGKDSTWFVAWNAQRQPIAVQGISAEAVPYPIPTSRHALTADRPWPRPVGAWHTWNGIGAGGIRVAVGTSLDDVHAELVAYAAKLLACCGGAWIAAMAGGALLASRVLRPIHQMSETAREIAGGKFDKRIDPRRTARELAQLAVVLNQAFDRMQHAVEQQTRFTADASHELHTPLSVLIARIELALRRPRPTDDYRLALEESLAAARRMDQLCRQLLELAVGDTAPQRPAFGLVDLADVAHHVCTELAPLAESAGLRLSCRADSALIAGNARDLSALASNLISNAIRYNRPGGAVDVQVCASDGPARLIVCDTGIGIPAEDQPRVFDRFFRVDRARSRAQAGAGLGLAIAQSIAIAHQGTINLVSCIDSGTTVTVEFPAPHSSDACQFAAADSPLDNGAPHKHDCSS